MSKRAATGPSDAVPTSQGPTQALWWRRGHVGVLTVLDVSHCVPLESVVAIDDSDSAVLSSDHAASKVTWWPHSPIQVVSAPLYGAEVSDGIPVDFVWPGPHVSSSSMSTRRRTGIWRTTAGASSAPML